MLDNSRDENEEAIEFIGDAPGDSQLLFTKVLEFSSFDDKFNNLDNFPFCLVLVDDGLNNLFIQLLDFFSVKLSLDPFNF